MKSYCRISDWRMLGAECALLFFFFDWLNKEAPAMQLLSLASRSCKHAYTDGVVFTYSIHFGQIVWSSCLITDLHTMETCNGITVSSLQENKKYPFDGLSRHHSRFLSSLFVLLYPQLAAVVCTYMHSRVHQWYADSCLKANVNKC